MTGQSVSYSFCIHEYKTLSLSLCYLHSGIKFIAVPPSIVRQSAASSPGKSISKCRTPTLAARM